MMNKLLILIAALSAPVMAEQASCEQLGGTAELIMKHRQANKPMNQIMTIVKQHAPALSVLVIQAYKEPLYSSESYKQKAIAEFRNDIELICYEGK